MSAPKRRAPQVDVRQAKDPLGRKSVLLQVGSDWWLTMSPDEARQLGVMLIATAEEIDGAAGTPLRFTCPRCGRTSYHPADVEAGYCGACHAWTGRP